jgi:hypothetical protein
VPKTLEECGMAQKLFRSFALHCFAARPSGQNQPKPKRHKSESGPVARGSLRLSQILRQPKRAKELFPTLISIHDRDQQTLCKLYGVGHAMMVKWLGCSLTYHFV